MVLLLVQQDDLAAATAIANSQPALRIFTTAGTANGNLSGTAGADLLCMNDGARPSGATYRALMVDTIPTRRATVTPNVGDGQVNWVLKATRRYVRSDGASNVMITNFSGLFDFGAYSLTNPVTFSGSSWTGFQSPVDWRVKAAQTCSDWTTATGIGTTGSNGGATATALSDLPTSCGTVGLSLICIEQ